MAPPTGRVARPQSWSLDAELAIGQYFWPEILIESISGQPVTPLHREPWANDQNASIAVSANSSLGLQWVLKGLILFRDRNMTITETVMLKYHIRNTSLYLHFKHGLNLLNTIFTVLVFLYVNMFYWAMINILRLDIWCSLSPRCFSVSPMLFDHFAVFIASGI